MNRSLARVLPALVAVLLTACSGSLTPSELRTSPQAMQQTQTEQPTQRVGESSAVAVPAAALSDTFESDAIGAPAPAWTTIDGTWKVCSVGGSSHEYCATSASNDETLAGSASWTDYTYDAFAVDAAIATGGASIIGRVRDANDFYELELRKTVNGTGPDWYLWRDTGGSWTPLASGAFTPHSTPYYRLRLVFAGTRITAYVAYDYGSDYQLLGSAVDATFPSGRIGLRSWGNGAIRFDGAHVTLAQAAPAPVTESTPAPAPVATTTTGGATSSGGATLPSVAAMSADAFVGTMGVDLDLVSPSQSEQPRIAAAFAGLGVRHTRLAVLEKDAPYEANVNALFAAVPNLRAYGLVNCSPPLGPYSTAVIRPSDVSGFQSRTGGHLDRIEMVNEPDNRGDGNWVSDTKACIAPFAGATNGVPLVAPALVTSYGGPHQIALGDLASSVSMGNIHRYFSGRNPGTSGWGGSDACGAYGALAWSICWGKETTPGEPVVVTETGWNSVSEVDEATQAKYTERVFFVNAQAGIAATSLYTFLGYTGGDGFGGTGLLRPDLSEKPAYVAVAKLAHVLADPGASFSPAPLALSIAPTLAAGSGLRSMLLGKRDGSYDLALWQEVSSANPDVHGQDVSIAATSVKISLASARSATAYAWQDDGSAPSTSLGTATSFSIPVTDRMTIVSLKAP